MLSHKQLTSLLNYDVDTGVFTWRERPARCTQIGDAAGSKHPTGYVFIKVRGTSYAAHRLAWFYVYRVWPADEIDHRNGVRDDNRIANLRPATSAENNQNVAIYSSNKSGYIGVDFHKASGRWRVRIQVGRQSHDLGLFDDPADAGAEYAWAKKNLHLFQPVQRA